MKRRIRFNVSWEEEQEMKRKYLAGLSYQEQLKNFFKTQKLFGIKSPVMRSDLYLSNLTLPKIPYRK